MLDAGTNLVPEPKLDPELDSELEPECITIPVPLRAAKSCGSYGSGSPSLPSP